MKKERLFLIILFIFMSLGFRVPFKEYRWNINETDQYLWIKPCERNIALPNDVDSNDSLYGNTAIVVTTALNSIANDVNDIFASYVRLEVYPADPNNLPPGSHFEIAKAQNRTITVCAGDPSALAGGHSQRFFEGKEVVGCEIVYDSSVHRGVKDYLAMMGHEIGHCLGLDHPQDISDSLMSYYSDIEKTYRLAPDDKLGIRYLYPANVPGVSHKEEATYGLSCAYKK